jgi:hypothetical protein
VPLGPRTANDRGSQFDARAEAIRQFSIYVLHTYAGMRAHGSPSQVQHLVSFLNVPEQPEFELIDLCVINMVEIGGRVCDEANILVSDIQISQELKASPVTTEDDAFSDRMRSLAVQYFEILREPSPCTSKNLLRGSLSSRLKLCVSAEDPLYRLYGRTRAAPPLRRRLRAVGPAPVRRPSQFDQRHPPAR